MITIGLAEEVTLRLSYRLISLFHNPGWSSVQNTILTAIAAAGKIDQLVQSIKDAVSMRKDRLVGELFMNPFYGIIF